MSIFNHSKLNVDGSAFQNMALNTLSEAPHHGERAIEWPHKFELLT